jgi:hypothetical protein
MKRLLFLLCALFVTARLSAQVEVHLTLPQEQFLPGEAIEAAVRISNFAGRKLTFGARPGWIRFEVEGSSDVVVNRLSEVSESGEFTLESSTRGTIRYDIQPHFDISRPGRYRVTAIVRISDTEEYASPPVSFEVFRGTRLWEREVGVSNVDGSPNGRRKFILQQATQLRNVRLYIRLTDSEEVGTMKVIPIGPTVSFSRPSCVVDRGSRLHCLHQISADTYRYHVVGPDGTLLRRHTFNFGERRPQLRMNDSGDVAVIGGERRRATDDIPVEPTAAAAGSKPDEAPATKHAVPAK